jgi:transposase
LQPTHKVALEGVEPTGQGCQVGQHRWKVEWTCAWLLHDRRQSRADEVVTANREAMLQLSMIRLLLKRLV